MPQIASAHDLIAYHEGCRLRVYDDATGYLILPGSTLSGHPTVGYGRALDVRGLSKHECEYLLKNDLALARSEASKYPWFNDLNEPRQAVVMSMIHQIGARGFARFRKTIAALIARDYETASAEMLDSRWARDQTPKRALHLAGILLTGTWDGTTEPAAE